MRLFVSIVLILSCPVTADEVRSYVEEAAKICDCSNKQPCLVEIEEKSEGYVVGVMKMVRVTDHGVAKFLPSKTYVMFDAEGELLRVVHTPCVHHDLGSIAESSSEDYKWLIVSNPLRVIHGYLLKRKALQSKDNSSEDLTNTFCAFMKSGRILGGIMQKKSSRSLPAVARRSRARAV